MRALRLADPTRTYRKCRKLASALFISAAATLLLASLVAAGCDSSAELAGLLLAPGEMMLPGATYSADLDGDEPTERLIAFFGGSYRERLGAQELEHRTRQLDRASSRHHPLRKAIGG